MKLILNEIQYDLIQSLLFENEGNSFYGLKSLMNNLNIGDKLALSFVDVVQRGKTYDLSINKDDNIFKLINKTETKLTLQEIKSKFTTT